MRRLGMPYGFVADNGQASPTSMGAARRAGAIGVSGEFGGGGTATPETMAITARAIDSLLLAMGDRRGAGPRPAARIRASRRSCCRSPASASASSRRAAAGSSPRSLGDRVAAGDLAGWYHDLERLERAGGGAALRRGRHRHLAAPAHHVRERRLPGAGAAGIVKE